MIEGVDASNHQGVIDWAAVAASGKAGFAFCKASEGPNPAGEWYTDPFFADNWRGIREAGMVRGAYHFGRPSMGHPEDEAAYFLRRVDDAGGLLPGDLLALDMEDRRVAPDADLLAWTLGFLRTVEAAVGFRPLLYSGAWYMQPHNLTGSTDLAQYGLWLAAYQGDAPEPPEPWPVLAFWQFSDSESVPGVGGPCDGDWFFGDAAQLRAYGAPAAVGQPTPLAVALAHLDEAEKHIRWAREKLTAGVDTTSIWQF